MKKLTERTCLEALRLLWAGVQHGAFVGADEGRVFVGFISKDRRCFRFTGATYEEALYTARAWTERNRTRFEAAAMPEEPYTRRPAPQITDEERAELGMSFGEKGLDT